MVVLNELLILMSPATLCFCDSKACEVWWQGVEAEVNGEEGVAAGEQQAPPKADDGGTPLPHAAPSRSEHIFLTPLPLQFLVGMLSSVTYTIHNSATGGATAWELGQSTNPKRILNGTAALHFRLLSIGSDHMMRC